MPGTIPELFDEAVAENPDKPWLVFEDRQYTYAQAREQVGRAAAGLADLGLGRGDVVMATMPSTPEHVFLWLGSAYAGTMWPCCSSGRATPRPIDHHRTRPPC